MSQRPNTESQRPFKRRALALVAGLALLLVVAAAAFANPFSGSDENAGVPGEDSYALSFDGEDFSGKGATNVVKTEPVAQRDSEEKYASACASCAKNHKIAEMPAASVTTTVAAGAPSNDEVEKLAKKQKKLNFASGDKGKARIFCCNQAC